MPHPKRTEKKTFKVGVGRKTSNTSWTLSVPGASPGRVAFRTYGENPMLEHEMSMTAYQAEELERCGYSCTEVKAKSAPSRSTTKPKPLATDEPDSDE